MFLTHLSGKVTSVPWRAAVEHVRAAHGLRKQDKRQVNRSFTKPHFQSPHVTYFRIWTAVVSFHTLTASFFAYTLSPVGTSDTGRSPQQNHAGHQGQDDPHHLQGQRVKMGTANLTCQVFWKLILCHLLCENQVFCQAVHTSSALSHQNRSAALYMPDLNLPLSKSESPQTSQPARKRRAESSDLIPCEHLGNDCFKLIF